MLAIEGTRVEGRQFDAVDASNVDSPACGIKARTDEGMDATVATEVMLGCHRVELVESQLSLAGEHAKARLGHAVPQRTTTVTQRAIAIDYVVELRLHLEGDAPAMARSSMRLEHVEYLLRTSRA